MVERPGKDRSRREVLASGARMTAMALGVGSPAGRSAKAAAVPDEAWALHKESLVIDLHVDSFLWTRLFGYNVGVRHENRLPFSPLGWHADLPRLRQGGVGAVGFGIVVNPLKVGPELLLPLKLLSWTERQRGFDAVLNTLDLMHAAARSYADRFAFVRTATELRTARAAGKIAGFACLEGAHGIEGSLDHVRTAYDRGLRSIGLVHFQATEAGYPMTAAKFDGRGLTQFGRELIGEMERLRMVVDLAHLNDAGFADALKVMRHPFIVSHTCCRGVYAHRRNLTDEQIRAVADRGGVIGIAFERTFAGGLSANLDSVLDHFDHAVKVGGEDVVAIGTDFDGFIFPPSELRDVSQMLHLTAGLLARGHRPETVRKILGGNALRVLNAVWG